MSDPADQIRDGVRYLNGFDVAGWPGHLRDEEVGERILAALDALEAERGLLVDAVARTEPFDRTVAALGSVQDQLNEAEARAEEYRQALEQIDKNGSRIGRKFTAQIARAALDETP